MWLPAGMGKLGGMGGNMQTLKKILEEIDIKVAGSMGKKREGLLEAQDIIRKHMNDGYDGWIPVEEQLPEDDSYILLSFDNFTIPIIGRYEERKEGGAFYLGDCDEDDTCISMNLFVNAWMPLPEPYQPKSKTPEEQQEWKERMLRNFLRGHETIRG